MKNIEKILEDANITKEKPFVIGVSGGLDSMVLLDYLHKANYKPIIVHFNHNTRKTNTRDEEFVKEYAIKNNIKHYIRNVIVDDGNFHNKARDLRYEKLRELALENDTPYILTGHHLDDLAETILIKITRGSNLYGYAGMHPIYKENNFVYVRPLLFTSRNIISTYAIEKHVLYVEDETNYDDTYLRNRYRHTIIPILKQENNQFLDRIENFHLQVSNAAIFIRDYCLKYIVDNKINISILLKQSEFIQESTIAILLENNGVTFNFKTLRKLVALINNDSPNLSYNLNNNKLFIKAYDEVLIIDNLDYSINELELKIGENKLSNMKSLTLLETPNKKDIDLIKICYNKLTFPLKIRNRVDGDLLTFDYGHKKLKDHLMDIKVPQYMRDRLLIITDSKDVILWIEDVYINQSLGDMNAIYIRIND